MTISVVRQPQTGDNLKYKIAECSFSLASLRVLPEIIFKSHRKSCSISHITDQIPMRLLR